MQRGEKRDFATAADCHQCRAAGCRPDPGSIRPSIRLTVRQHPPGVRAASACRGQQPPRANGCCDRVPNAYVFFICCRLRVSRCSIDVAGFRPRSPAHDAGLSPCARNTIREAISRDTPSSQHAGHAVRRNRTRSAAGTFSGHRQRSRRICHQRCGWPSLSDHERLVEESTRDFTRSSVPPFFGTVGLFNKLQTQQEKRRYDRKRMYRDTG